MGWFNDQAPPHEGYMIGIRAVTTERKQPSCVSASPQERASPFNADEERPLRWP